MDIAKLTAKLELQSSQFQSELEKTNRKLLGFQSTSSKALSGIEKQAKAFGRALTGMFAGLSLSLATGAIKQAIQLGDEIGKAAVKAGIGTNAMSELAFAARMADVDLAGLSNSIKFMQVSLSKANSGGKEQLEVLTALGLKLDDLRRLSPDKQFEAFADAIASLRDPADKARAAVAFLGKSGAELLPLFAQGAEGIKLAREEAKKLGMSLDEDVIKSLQDGDDAIKKLGVGWDVFWSGVAVGTVNLGKKLDLINKDKLGELKDQLRDARGELSSIPADGAFEPERFKKAADAVAALTRQIENLQNTYTRGGGSRRGAGKPAAPGFAGPAIGPFTKDDFSKLMEGSALRRSIRDMEEWRATVDTADKALADGLIKDLKNLEGNLEDLQEPIAKTTTDMTIFGQRAAENMQDAFAQFLFDPFEGGLKGMLKGFVDVLRRMAAEAAAAQIFDKIGGTEGIGNLFTSFFTGASKSSAPTGSSGGWSGPRYASGTNYVPSDGLAMLHKGEAVVPAHLNVGGGGMGVTIVNHNDNRGTTKESLPLLLASQKQNNEKLKADIISGIQSGRYPISK